MMLTVSIGAFKRCSLNIQAVLLLDSFFNLIFPKKIKHFSRFWNTMKSNIFPCPSPFSAKLIRQVLKNRINITVDKVKLGEIQ